MKTRPITINYDNSNQVGTISLIEGTPVTFDSILLPEIAFDEKGNGYIISWSIIDRDHLIKKTTRMGRYGKRNWKQEVQI